MRPPRSSLAAVDARRVGAPREAATRSAGPHRRARGARAAATRARTRLRVRRRRTSPQDTADRIARMPGSDTVAAPRRRGRRRTAAAETRPGPAGSAGVGDARPRATSPAALPTPASRRRTTAATRTCARRRWPSRSTRATSRRPCASPRARGLAVRIRAGGHSYIGASTVAGGVVLDLRRLRGIKLLADGSVLAGAGLRQIELIAALARRGRAVVHGSCPTVGVAGFTLGGGYGFDARRYGLACDTLVAAQVVDLRTLAPGAADADLLRGLRGAGASLAPVTALQLKTHPVGAVTTFFAGYPWSRAAEIVSAFTARCALAPAPLASICSVSTGSGSATVEVFGQYLGTGARRREGDQGLASRRREAHAEHAHLPRRAADLRRLPRQDDGAVQAGERGRDARHRYVRRGLRVYRARAELGAEARSARGRHCGAPGFGWLGRAAAGCAGRGDRRRCRRRDVVRSPRDAVVGADPELRVARGDAWRRSASWTGRARCWGLWVGVRLTRTIPDANLGTWRAAYYGREYSDLVCAQAGAGSGVLVAVSSGGWGL